MTRSPWRQKRYAIL